jgi:hypothetical protein
MSWDRGSLEPPACPCGKVSAEIDPHHKPLNKLWWGCGNGGARCVGTAWLNDTLAQEHAHADTYADKYARTLPHKYGHEHM